MTSGGSDWCTIESDPGVFTSLIESFGIDGVELTELYSLDDESLAGLGSPTYGLIFLFKWVQAMESSDAREVLQNADVPSNLFFAKQVITNACATQAILSILLNSSDIEKGEMLDSLKEFTMAFDPEMRGESIGNSDQIKSAHNSFGRQDADPFIREHLKDDKDGEAFHFVAFIPFEGKVYELDGLKNGPILLGDIPDGSGVGNITWLSIARQAIQDRIERYSASEIKFNLMAMVQDKRIPIRGALNCLPDEDDDCDRLRAQLIAEDQKREQWKLENKRRQHNYIPFCLELMKQLAASGKLPELTKKANEKFISQREKMKNK